MNRLYIISFFPLTGLAENSFCNSWGICCATLEITEEMGNQFSVDHIFPLTQHNGYKYTWM